MKLTPEAIAELKAMEDRRGRLTPHQVVEAAEPEGSALHDCFEWDDSIAGAAYRVEQARELLKRVKIELVIEDRSFRTVGYVRDPSKQQNKPGYVATLKVRVSDTAALMQAELDAISALCDRAIGLAYAKAENLPGLAEKITGIKVQVVRLANGLE